MDHSRRRTLQAIAALAAAGIVRPLWAAEWNKAAFEMKTLPDATVAIKWGVPVYAVKGRNVCALAVFKDHIGMNFFASPDKLIDPKKKLEGEGKTSRMLKIRSAADIDTPSIAKWLKAAATR